MMNSSKVGEISILINSVYFFIECVFILRFHDHYRLVALHKGRVLTDTRYRTIRGARIAFSKMYKNKSWEKKAKAEWSPFYNPDAQWLGDKTRDIRVKEEMAPGVYSGKDI